VDKTHESILCHSLGLLLHGTLFRPFNPSTQISVKQILTHQTEQQVLQLHTAYQVTRYRVGCIYHVVHAPTHSVVFHVDKWKSGAFSSGFMTYSKGYELVSALQWEQKWSFSENVSENTVQEKCNGQWTS
jgi:hypothetical protein